MNEEEAARADATTIKRQPQGDLGRGVETRASRTAQLWLDLSSRVTDIKIIIHYRGPKDKVTMVEELFSSFKSRYVYLTYEEHDEVTANTQAVTHAAFLR